MKRLVKLAISLLVALGDTLRESALRLAGRTPRATCVVLYYHAVPADQRKHFAVQMDRLLRHARPVKADNERPLEPGRHYAAVTFDDGFVSVIQNALPELESRGIPATLFVPTNSMGQRPLWVTAASAPARKERVLSAQELKNLNGAGLMAIGSHSVNHPNFLKSTPDQVRAELFESKSTLETVLGREVTLFSFPHGAHDEQAVAQARAAGYRRVFTILPRTAFVPAQEFVTGRTLADPSDWPLEFLLKLRGAYRWLCLASALKHRRRPAGALNALD